MAPTWLPAGLCRLRREWGALCRRMSHPDILVQTPHLRHPTPRPPGQSLPLPHTLRGGSPPLRRLCSQFTKKEKEAQSGMGTGWPKAPEGHLRKELEVRPRPAEPGQGHPHPTAPE